MGLLRCKIGSSILAPIILTLSLALIIGVGGAIIYLGNEFMPEFVGDIVLYVALGLSLLLPLTIIWLALNRHCSEYWRKRGKE